MIPLPTATSIAPIQRYCYLVIYGLLNITLTARIPPGAAALRDGVGAPARDHQTLVNNPHIHFIRDSIRKFFELIIDGINEFKGLRSLFLTLGIIYINLDYIILESN